MPFHSHAMMSRLFGRYSGAYWYGCALFLLLATLDAWVFDVGKVVDLRAGDVLLRLSAPQTPASRDTVIVDIDNRSLQEMNDDRLNPAPTGQWPWPRAVYGELIDYLERQHPRAIVFDLFFADPDAYRPELDQAFIESVLPHQNIYFASVLNQDGEGTPIAHIPAGMDVSRLAGALPDARASVLLPALFAQHPTAMRGGIVNFAEDSDRVGRGYLLHLDHAGWRFGSLPDKLAADFGWPRPPQARILLNWRRSWRHISFADVYFDAQHMLSQRPVGEFTGKIVVIGTAATGNNDLRLTPLSSLYPGVEILATAIDNLAARDWLREIPRSMLLPFNCLLLLGTALAFARGRSVLVVGVGLLVVNLLSIACAWLALRQHYWLPIYAGLALGWLYYLLGALLAYLRERQQRARAIGMFKRFLDPRVVGDLIERGEIDTHATPQSREVTVLFSDIRGFTTMSETSTPQAIVALLNRYFSVQVEIIFRHGGTLDKFIGDAIMAIWGAPVHDPDHAAHAVAAALEMSLALESFKAELAAAGQAFEIGIGLHSGAAVVGFIGSADRLDYTAIGDTVNLASRIEGQTKGVARILISAATMQAAGDRFRYRHCGEHHVKGREQAVMLYEPMMLSTSAV